MTEVFQSWVRSDNLATDEIVGRPRKYVSPGKAGGFMM